MRPYLRSTVALWLGMFATPLHVAAERMAREREVARAQAFGRYFSELRGKRPPRRTRTTRPAAAPSGPGTVLVLGLHRPTPIPPAA